MKAAAASSESHSLGGTKYLPPNYEIMKEIL
jgi:hypothetical protein